MKPEILAPAGSFESVAAAVLCGANAVYLGGTSFSARQNAANFSDEELEEAIRFCHLRGVKVHQAINTLAFDNQLGEVLETAVRSACMGVDAFIIQDLGVLREIRAVLPDMPLHASTQMSVHTKDGALLMKEMGFSRVVVSRELSLSQIKEICTAPIEVEAFVHGALCMSVSGQCYMSAMIGSRSANRGLCAQACRLPFSADSTAHCALSLKDLSYVEKISELENAGVVSLKIEGRMKRPEYVAAAVSAVKAALYGEKADMHLLRAVFSRNGFTSGYLDDKLGSDMFGIREKEDVVAAKDALPSLAELYRKETPSVEISLSAEIRRGKHSSLRAEHNGISAGATGDIPDEAKSKALDEDTVSRHLSKLGGTPFFLREIRTELDDGLFLSAASLNELRRRVTEQLEEEIIRQNTPKYTEKNAPTNSSPTARKVPRGIRLSLQNAKQLPDDLSNVEAVILPLSHRKELTPSDKIFLALPRFITDEENVRAELTQAKNDGFTHAYCNNLSHIKTARDLGFTLHGGYGLNVLNSLSCDELADLGLKDFETSFEIKLTQLSRLSSPVARGIIAYGKLPLMLTRNCPIKSQVGCKDCQKLLTDRTAREFPVCCTKDYAEILNSDTLFLADRLPELSGADFLTLMINDETKEQVCSLIEKYRTGASAPDGITRGLYYRGIL